MKLIFEGWRKYLKESERPGAGHTKSRYEQCPEKIVEKPIVHNVLFQRLWPAKSAVDVPKQALFDHYSLYG